MNWRKQYEAEIMPDGHLRIRNIGEPRSGQRAKYGGPTSRVSKMAWGALQAIKNEMLGPEVTCVEIFPAEQDMVDEGEYRHLWPVNAESLPGWSYDAASPSGRRKREPARLVRPGVIYSPMMGVCTLCGGLGGDLEDSSKPCDVCGR